MLNDFLSRLHGVRKQNGYFKARCPAHDDKHASLSISEADGKLLVKCHAGCSYQSIMDCIGYEPPNGVQFNNLPDRVPREIESVYQYFYEDGTHAYDICRMAGKVFRARLADGTWSIKDARKVLYRLPEILAGKDKQWVFVTEGEKDADAIVATGGTATCNPFGAGGWKDEYSDSLRDAKVCIVADKDETGIKHAKEVAKSLNGIAKEIRIVQAAEGKDASDHLSLGYTRSEFVPIEDIALEEIEIKPDGIVLTKASEVLPEDIEWLDGAENQIAYGLMSALVGMPGVNKTTFACRISAKVSQEGNGILFVSAEDSPSVLRGRLQAAGANIGLCYFGSIRRDGYDGGLILVPEDVQNLEEIIQTHNIKLLVLDPVQAHFGSGIDSNRDQSVRSALAPLATVGIRNHCAILLLMHLNKGISNDPFTRSGGSIGIPAIARVCLLMGNHPDHTLDENLRIVVGFKNAYGPQAHGQTYRLRLNHVENYDDLQIMLEGEGPNRIPAWRVLAQKGNSNEDRSV